MKTKNNSTTIKIEPKACPCCTNPESAARGEAAIALNLRECSQALVATGQPRRIAQLAEGEKLLHINSRGQLITATGDNIACGGSAVCSLGGATPVSAVQSGHFLNILASEGTLHLAEQSGRLTQFDSQGALPVINLCETESATMSCPVSAYTFSRPLSAWQSPLTSEDAANLAKRESQIRATLTGSASAQGRHTGLMLVRYGVRMWDDSYLWMSAPVLLGAANASGNYRHTATAVTSGNTYTGIGDSTVSVAAYRIGMTVISGIDSKWHGMVKAIDVLATKEIQPYDTASLDYRFSRPATLDLGPAPRSKAAVVAQLLNSSWHIVASTANLASLGNHAFSAHNVTQSSQTHFPSLHSLAVSAPSAEAAVITPAVCANAVESSARRHIPRCITVTSGRLVAAGGTVRNCIPWHPATIFAGSSASGSCTVTTSVRIATQQGFATISRTDALQFTPSALGSLIAYPDSRAVSVTFALSLPDGSARSCSASLASASGMAVGIMPDVLTFAAASSVSGDTQAHFDENADGLISSSLPGNPFVQAGKRVDTGLSISSICAAHRPLYSGGTGRYPLYVFSSQGIYALPSATGGFGEPRALSGITASHLCTPCCGEGCVWFIDSHNRLCRLTGTKVEIVHSGIAATSLAWDGMHRELHIAAPNGQLLALQPSGRIASRSTQATSLLNCGSSAYAVTPDGAVADLTDETSQPIAVSYLSQPVPVAATPLGARLSQVVWNVCGSVSGLRLSVSGERGVSCHGFTINSVTANGTLGAALPIRLVSQPLRTFRLAVSGTVTPGTLLLPIAVYVSSTHAAF